MKNAEFAHPMLTGTLTMSKGVLKFVRDRTRNKLALHFPKHWLSLGNFSVRLVGPGLRSHNGFRAIPNRKENTDGHIGHSC